MVTAPLAGTSPDQLRVGLAKATVPELATTSLSHVASSRTPPIGSVKLAPRYGLAPEFAIVIV